MNYELNILNIKYYSFGLSFDTSEFYSGNVHMDVELNHSIV
jgi:hypothetical protein